MQNCENSLKMLVLSDQQPWTQWYSVYYHIRQRKAANSNIWDDGWLIVKIVVSQFSDRWLFNNRLVFSAVTVNNTKSWPIDIHMISLMSGKLTSIFTHDGSLDVVRCTVPHADGLWIAAVHGLSLLVETVVPANDTKYEKLFPKRNSFTWLTDPGLLQGNTKVKVLSVDLRNVGF